MKEKERYIYTKIDGYYWIKDIETNENYCVDKKIVKLFNQQDKEIAKLQYRLEVAEKALELACKEELREIGIYDDDSDYEKEMSISKQQYIEQAEREVKGVKK